MSNIVSATSCHECGFEAPPGYESVLCPRCPGQVLLRSPDMTPMVHRDIVVGDGCEIKPTTIDYGTIPETEARQLRLAWERWMAYAPSRHRDATGFVVAAGDGGAVISYYPAISRIATGCPDCGEPVSIPGVEHRLPCSLAAMDTARKALSALTDDQRLALFREHCPGCGTHDPRCQCGNDE